MTRAPPSPPPIPRWLPLWPRSWRGAAGWTQPLAAAAPTRCRRCWTTCGGTSQVGARRPPPAPLHPCAAAAAACPHPLRRPLPNLPPSLPPSPRADPRHSLQLPDIAHRVLDLYGGLVGRSPEVDAKLMQARRPARRGGRTRLGGPLDVLHAA